MKTKHDIYWEFLTIAYEYGMYDNLTQTEIDELVVISENKTFRTLCKRYKELPAKRRKGEFGVATFYQVMRPTVILMATHLEQQLAKCHSLRVRAIVGGYRRTMLDKMEYNINIYQWKYVNLIKAFPNMSDADLAKYCVTHKIELTNEPKNANDINWLTQVFQDARKGMNDSWATGTAPITAHESIFAERWIEIFERQR